MVPGFNTSVTCAGVEYHVQSEDLGKKNPCILTLVYRGGAIVHREKTNYVDALGPQPAPPAIRIFMDAQHRRVMAGVTAGEIPSPPPAA
jgi:hypothetical protein